MTEHTGVLGTAAHNYYRSLGWCPACWDASLNSTDGSLEHTSNRYYRPHRVLHDRVWKQLAGAKA